MLHKFLKLSGSSGIALWTFTLKEAGSNLLEILKILSLIYVPFLYTSRLKAPGSNPLNNSRGGGGGLDHSKTVCLGFCIYH